MEIEELRQRLEALDNSQRHEVWEAYGSAGLRGGGGSQAWNIYARRGTQEGLFVTKFANNPQEPPSGPRKIVASELICGRLGRLFHRPITPLTVPIRVSQELVDEARIAFSNGTRAQAGFAVGSQFVHGALDSKAGGRLDFVERGEVARVVLFQTWLGMQDPAALVVADTGEAFSIDHGYFLCGSRWGALPRSVQVVTPHGAPRDQAWAFSLFSDVLEELRSLGVEELLSAFSGIPESWGLSLEFRAELASVVLERRESVGDVILAFCRR